MRTSTAMRRRHAPVIRACSTCSPTSAPALHLAGMFARADGDTETRRATLFAQPFDTRPTFVDARAALARLETLAGNADEAVSVAREGLATLPESAVLWRALGEAELSRAKCGSRGRGVRRGTAARSRARRDALQPRRRVADDARRRGGRACVPARAGVRTGPIAADFNLGVMFDQQGNANAAIAAFSNVLSAGAGLMPPRTRRWPRRCWPPGLIDKWFANFERFERIARTTSPSRRTHSRCAQYRADFRATRPIPRRLA